MALNFPNSPTDGQKFVDTNGTPWVYETATNSWTAGSVSTGGMIYKGGLDITATPPTGAAAGWTYSVTTGGTANAGFTGLTGNIAKGTQIIYDGTNWQVIANDNPWVKNGTTLAPKTAGDKALSSDVSFTQAGTGAVARTVDAKLKDVVSVKDFGAKGDGTTDDTAAIQAALNSGAKRVIFPAGTYLIGSGQGVVVKSNTAVSGYGATLKNTRFQNPSSRTAKGDALYCGLIVNMGSSDITIEGFTIEGPTPTSISQSNMAYNSIGINIRGQFDRWYIDAVDDTTTGTSKNITIRDCTIYGWYQSGIIADYVDNLLIESCYVHTCGRDGIRLYGCAFFDVSRNRVHNITPGFSNEGIAPNNNSYGIAASRVYRSEAGDGSVNLYRRSQDGLICHNRVTQVPTWKPLDTHGGERITFSHNYVYGGYVGIGIAIGGDSLTTGYVPPKDITVSYNEIRQNQANVATYGNRSGVMVYADAWDDNNRGLDVTVTGNTIEGYGVLNTKGGIEISNFRNVSITGNKIKNCRGSGISFSNDNDNVYIAGNLIQDVVSSAGVCRGIQVQAGFTHDIFVESGQFYQAPGGTTLVAIYSTEVDSAGFTGLRVDANLDYKGNVTPISAPSNLSTLSQNNMVPIAWANVDVSGGAATLRSGRGVASVAWSSTGVVNITLAKAVPSANLTCGLATTRQNADVVCASAPISPTQYAVYTYLAGTLSDKNFCWVLYGVRNT